MRFQVFTIPCQLCSFGTDKNMFVKEGKQEGKKCASEARSTYSRTPSKTSIRDTERGIQPRERQGLLQWSGAFPKQLLFQLYFSISWQFPVRWKVSSLVGGILWLGADVLSHGTFFLGLSKCISNPQGDSQTRIFSNAEWFLLTDSRHLKGDGFLTAMSAYVSKSRPLWGLRNWALQKQGMQNHLSLLNILAKTQ